jgi:hypothetical protein
MFVPRRTLKFYGSLVLVVTLGIAIALLRPQPALSDDGLTGLVNSAYLPRAEDPALHDIAHQRAVEISTDWSHNGRREGTAEVLAYNSGFADPASKALSQWQGSPTHHAILSDPTYTRLGCGSHQTPDGTHWFACVLAAEPVGAARTPNPTPVGSIPTSGANPVSTPQPVTLPDTRMP